MRFSSNTQEGLRYYMCNCYTTGFNYGQTSCNYNSCGYNTYGGCGCGNGRQMTCRDGCENLWVSQRNRNTCCSCGVCGGNGETAQNGNGQNGGFTCVTFCRQGNSTCSTNSCDLYYARQYGLYPFGGRRSCGCTLDAVSET